MLGRAGERLAVDLYLRGGFSIADRNYRSSGGEIDVVARKGKLLVFCEVKTRHSDRWGLPAEAVAWGKQQRLRRLAAQWMSEHRPGDVEVRFDVVSIVVEGGRARPTLIPAAF